MFEQQIGSVSRSIPIIFPDSLIHEEVYIAIRELVDGNITSAGDISSTTLQCSGKSTTLKIESREEDSEIIRMYDYFHGVKL